MFEQKRVTICVDKSRLNRRARLVEIMASIGVMARSKCEQCFQENWILQSKGNEASEWIFIAVIYDKQLTDTCIIWGKVISVIHVSFARLKLTIVHIISRYTI